MPELLKTFAVLWVAGAAGIAGATGVWFIGNPRIRNVLLAVTTLAFTMATLEVGGALWTGVSKMGGRSTQKQYSVKGKLTYRDDVLGYAPYPDNSALESSHIGGEPVYVDTLYVFDGKARRVLPIDSPAPNHALFFGGSYTFGEGLPNDATLSARFQVHSSGKFQSFNYGFKGYGPNQMLCILRDDAKFDDIPQRNGVAIYGFIDDHIWRTVGAPWQLTIVDKLPVMRLDADGRLDGPLDYREVAPVRRTVTVYKAFQTYSAFGRALIAEGLIVPGTAHDAMRVTAETIVECARLYKSRFGGEFYTVIWPRRRMPEEQETAFIAALEAGGVLVLQPPPLPDEEAAVLHPVDRHPSAQEVDWIARFLADEIASPEVAEPAASSGR